MKVVRMRSLLRLRLSGYSNPGLRDIAEVPKGTRRPIDSDNLRHNRAVLFLLKPERERCRTAPTQPGERKTIVSMPGICLACRRPHKQPSFMKVTKRRGTLWISAFRDHGTPSFG